MEANILRPGVIVDLSQSCWRASALWGRRDGPVRTSGNAQSALVCAQQSSDQEFWYYNDKVLGPHHFHELESTEGVVLILATIALYVPLERKLRVLPKPAFERGMKNYEKR